jgi:hypothetical protein
LLYPERVRGIERAFAAIQVRRAAAVWVLDNGLGLSTYRLSDDLSESIWKASIREEDHKPLTRDEVEAWQQAAATAKHINVLEVVDLLDEESQLEVFDANNKLRPHSENEELRRALLGSA